ncbi:MAG: hypothetical protein LBR26_07555 [Prevotella sp.]|jgi:hypothetical protein|nr:hypothetical protein [Prevotella sp.]
MMHIIKFIKYLWIGIMAGCLCLFSCDTTGPGGYGGSSRFPSTQEEWEQAAETAQQITEKSNAIIESVVSSAYWANELIDPEVILEQVRLIKEVESAELTSNGSAIVVKQKEGIAINLLIVTADDERFFMEETNQPALRSAHQGFDDNSRTFLESRSGDEDYILPGGNGRALILAPFQHSFKKDIEYVISFLKSAGYSENEIDCFEDEKADWSKFQSDFLSDYDVVFIDTHGGIDMSTIDQKATSTALLTGTKWDSSNSYLLSETINNYQQLSIGGVSKTGINYIAVTVPWLKANTTKKFNNSWIYIGACYSSAIKTGASSLVAYFINEGAAGYNGYDNTIYTGFANLIEQVMFFYFTSGLSFTEASDAVREYNELKRLQLKYRLNRRDGPAMNVDLFSHTAKYTEPFHLILPNKPEMNTVGISELTKNSVKLNGKFISDVSITEAGFYLSTNPDPVNRGEKRTIGYYDMDQQGNFALTWTGLSPKTTYYYAAFATSARGTGYGEVKEFTTLDERGITDEINKIVPKEIQQKMTDLGMPIYGGGNPASIAGTYKISPNILKATSIANDFSIGHQFGDNIVTFSAQSSADLTIKVNKAQGGGTGEGVGAYIVGEGSTFSVFVEMISVQDGYQSKSVEVYSGILTQTGMKDLHYSLFMIDNGGNPELIENGQGRVFYDFDGFSEKTAAGTRSSANDTGLLPSDASRK